MYKLRVIIDNNNTKVYQQYNQIQGWKLNNVLFYNYYIKS